MAHRCIHTPPRSGTPSGSTWSRRRRSDVLSHVWQPRYLAWSLALVRKGGLTHEGIPTAQAFDEDIAATLPGAR